MKALVRKITRYSIDIDSIPKPGEGLTVAEGINNLVKAESLSRDEKASFIYTLLEDNMTAPVNDEASVFILDNEGAVKFTGYVKS